MDTPSPPPIPKRSLSRNFSKLSIKTAFTRPSLPRMDGMDIADVKLHKLIPAVSVKELPSSPASVSSSGSYSSISSTGSSVRAIYPPDVFEETNPTEAVLFGPSPDKQRLGSIDQMIEWTRNVNSDSVRYLPKDTNDIPPSGSQCPRLSSLPKQTMDLCESAWSRVQEKMGLQLVCRGVESCSTLGLYEIRSGSGQGAYVAAIILYARHIYKAPVLERRLRDIAEQEWRDIPPIRVWWVEEQPGKCVMPPIANDNAMAWAPIDFKDGQNYRDSISTIDITTSRVEELVEARLNRLNQAMRPGVRRRKSSYWMRSPEEQSPLSVKDNTLLADELEARLRKLILSN